MTLLFEVIIMVLAFVVHELGHYFAFKYHKISCKIKAHWWGASVEADKPGQTTVKQIEFVLITGIYVGCLILLFSYWFYKIDRGVFIFYFLISYADLISYYYYLQYKNKNDTLLQVMEKEYLKMKEERDAAA